ncbi:MAG: hypothetical protein PVH41_18430 [Anaerolineae bacterium]
MTKSRGASRRDPAETAPDAARLVSGSGTGVPKDRPSLMEFSSLPLDPIYAWGMVLEPVETLIRRTSDFVELLARETVARAESMSDDELERRFLDFFDGLVEAGTLRRLPDAPPELGRRILGPRRWVRAQRIRIERLVQYWAEQGEPD